MSLVEDELTVALRTRDAARDAFQDRLASVQAALAEQGPGARAAHDAVAKLRSSLDETAEVARQSQWVIGATLIALIAWAARRPLLAGTARAGRSGRDWLRRRREPASRWQRWRDWTVRKAKL